MTVTPAVKFLELIFRINFLSSILAKCLCDESCSGVFRQLLQKVLRLWRKHIFVYIDEDFAIN